jgi:hypothetical protein
MNRSNVTIRSNVYIRASVPLDQDKAFLAQVRGRTALITLLRRIAPDKGLQAAARESLTARQIADVAWQVPCVCGAYPEGPIVANGNVEIQFRCPNSTCKPTNSRPRITLLDAELVDRCAKTFGMMVPDLVTLALATPQTTYAPDPTRRRLPYTIRLTLFQDQMLTDQDIECALHSLIEVGR